MKKTPIQHARGVRNRLKKRVKDSGVLLEGKVLDLCCGSVSIGSMYSPQKVICYDNNMCHLEALDYKGIRVVKGDIIDPYFPFKDNSFDFCFGSGIPTIWYRTKMEEVDKSLTPLQEKVKKQRYVKRIISEMIRVTKNDVIIHSTFFFRNFPEEYFERVKREVGNYLIVLDCRD
jgi:SAM-dependent methyltransferase